MEKSFFIIPRENQEFLDSPSSCSLIIAKIETINSICDSENDTYKTEHLHIVKLCRYCITDICKELIVRANFATTRYKKYTAMRNSLLDGSYYYPDEEKDRMVRELENNIIDAKHRYSQYYALLSDFKKKKLFTTACILCSIFKE